MWRFDLTEKPNAAGGRKVHALLGGGPGLKGKYIKGETWCGVHLRRPALLLVDTRAPVTCKTCLKAIGKKR